jgi:hypothetical protein
MCGVDVIFTRPKLKRSVSHQKNSPKTLMDGISRYINLTLKALFYAHVSDSYLCNCIPDFPFFASNQKILHLIFKESINFEEEV